MLSLERKSVEGAVGLARIHLAAKSVNLRCGPPGRLGDRARVTLALYRRRAFRKKVCTRAVLRRAFDKAVRRKPPVVAADAGLMQIQLWEGSLSRCAEAVRQSTTDDSGS